MVIESGELILLPVKPRSRADEDLTHHLSVQDYGLFKAVYIGEA